MQSDQLNKKQWFVFKLSNSEFRYHLVVFMKPANYWPGIYGQDLVLVKPTDSMPCVVEHLSIHASLWRS